MSFIFSHSVFCFVYPVLPFPEIANFFDIASYAPIYHCPPNPPDHEANHFFRQSIAFDAWVRILNAVQFEATLSSCNLRNCFLTPQHMSLLKHKLQNVSCVDELCLPTIDCDVDIYYEQRTMNDYKYQVEQIQTFLTISCFSSLSTLDLSRSFLPMNINWSNVVQYPTHSSPGNARRDRYYQCDYSSGVILLTYINTTCLQLHTLILGNVIDIDSPTHLAEMINLCFELKDLVKLVLHYYSDQTYARKDSLIQFSQLVQKLHNHVSGQPHVVLCQSENLLACNLQYSDDIENLDKSYWIKFIDDVCAGSVGDLVDGTDVTHQQVKDGLIQLFHLSTSNQPSSAASSARLPEVEQKMDSHSESDNLQMHMSHLESDTSSR